MRLRQFQEDLEANQQRANRLKSSKFEIKSKSTGLTSSIQSEDLSESDGSSTSSIDNLTDRYMDIQDQVEDAIEQFETFSKFHADVNDFDETIGSGLVIWTLQLYL